MAITLNGSGGVTGLTALPDSAMASGSILQIVQTEKTDTTSTTSTSWTDLSGMSASITPSSSSNKILVTAFLSQFVGTDAIYVALCSGDGTNLLGGDSAVGAETPSAGGFSGGSGHGEAYFGSNPATLVKLHSPNTTSSFTYKIRWRVNNGTGVFNRNHSDSGQYFVRCASNITLMEIAA
tara:strand:- start:52 stop:591 length:540 start_codon:yes stop_codon:yes gene_type:complete